MYDDGYLADGLMMEWLSSHTNVVMQRPMQALNPYALGFAMYTDMKRICEQPTEEDRRWFPDLAGTPWLPSLSHAMRNFKDESFIGQYLSPKVMRDLRLFAILDDEAQPDYEISAIHDEDGYRHVRRTLSNNYDLGSREPNIQVWNVNLRGDRSLLLRHTQHRGQPLDSKGAQEVLKHVARLWGFGVHLESAKGDDITQRWSVVAPST
jgi:stage V sporulation protein R